MARVSKTPLPESVQQKLRSQLSSVLQQPHTDAAMSSLIADILGENEQIMLMKRIAIIGMLHNKCSSYEIHTALHVSTATVKKFRHNLSFGEYRSVVEFFENKKNARNFWETVDLVLRAGMPPMGRRWSRTYKLRRE